MFKKCIARRPCENITKGLTTANLGLPNYDIALKQHDAYIRALEAIGAKVKVLDADERFPDSCFVEDVAVVVGDLAIITHPGAPTRLREIEIIRSVLEKEFKHVETISAPGTLEGGDVMQIDNHFYIGQSHRTNRDGANQLIAILKTHGYDGTIVPFDDGLLHLKTGMTYLDHQNLLMREPFMDFVAFNNFNKILVDTDEAYAANCIFNNGTVIMPEGYEKTKKKIQTLGYEIIEVPMSEFERIDGGLTCLSLRY